MTEVSDPLLLYVVYMRDFEAVVASQHLRRIRELMTAFPRHRIMVVGDFNMPDIRWIADDTDNFFVPTGLISHSSQYFRDAAKFLNEMFELPLYQLSDVQNTASNVLDLLFVNDFADVRMSVDRSMVVEQCLQDAYHVPYEIWFEYSKRSIINRTETINVFCYKRGNYERMCRQLYGINFAHEFNQRDFDAAFEYFST